MPKIKIMNWNIQQFSQKRIGEDIRLNAAAEIIVNCNVDIFVIIELQSIEVPAVSLCNDILKEIHKLTNRKYAFILTDYNGLEVYPYFYDINTIIPYPLTKKVYDREVIAEDKIKDLEVFNCKGLSSETKYDEFKPYYTCYFPLIDYPDRIGRAPGLGVFQEISTKEFFCIIAWHNMAQLRGSSGPAKNITNISQASYIKNKEIKLIFNSNELKIDDLILTGDFNVNLYKTENIISSCYFNFFISNYNIVEKKEKSYLAEYDPDNDFIFDSSKKVRTNLFDNFIVCNNTFKTNGSIIIDIPNVIYNSTTLKKRFFVDSGLSSVEYFYEHFIKRATKKFEKLRLEEDFFIGEKYVDLIEKLIESVEIQNFDISNDSYHKIHDILVKFDGGKAIYDEMVDDAEDFIKKYGERARLFKQKGLGNITTNYNDCLLLTRSFYSDHLPVIIEIEKK